MLNNTAISSCAYSVSDSVTSLFCATITSKAKGSFEAADGKVKRGGSLRGFKFKEVGKYIRRMASNYLSVRLFGITHANVS
jgi:hypothetical protein